MARAAEGPEVSGTMQNTPKPQHKNDPLRGARWEDLATPGDIQRYLRWIILQTKADKMDVRKASIMGQLGLYMLRVLEVTQMEAKLLAMEQRLVQAQNYDEPCEPAVTH